MVRRSPACGREGSGAEQRADDRVAQGSLQGREVVELTIDERGVEAVAQVGGDLAQPATADHRARRGAAGAAEVEVEDPPVGPGRMLLPASTWNAPAKLCW